ncbi:MAG: hypothetical protein KAV87_32855, partial [Desulfobacteraceae bacterium]|nr:hypothetical protein [Desulfobacteraceae bacterium]
MLEALKFVQGAVAKKDFVPSLTHFSIKDGNITGFNGKIGLSSPVDIDLTISPKATPFVKAIQSCKDKVTMHVTAAGRLAIKSGTFKVFLDCTEEPFPITQPKGERIDLPDGGLLAAIKVLAPFIAEDASRPWARGILFKGQTAFATNNICLMEYWLGFTFPFQVNIPHAAIKELLRIKEEPVAIQVTENLLFFHFKDGKWLSTTLSSLEWPDLSKVLDKESTPIPLPEEFFTSIREMNFFIGELGKIFLRENIAATHLDADTGAKMEFPT